jgi:hypothetical protein
MIIACSTLDCPAVIEVPGPVSPTATYTCRKHTGQAEDKVRFQESQFDPQIGAGTDPKSYERGAGRFGTHQSGRAETGKVQPISTSKSYRKRIVEQAKIELAGHENSKEILKILNADTRDANSGTTKNK